MKTCGPLGSDLSNANSGVLKIIRGR